MKWTKITTLLVSLMATAIIVFNNLIQLAERLFLPEVKQGMIQAFLIIIITIIIYAIANREILR